MCLSISDVNHIRGLILKAAACAERNLTWSGEDDDRILAAAISDHARMCLCESDYRFTFAILDLVQRRVNDVKVGPIVDLRSAFAAIGNAINSARLSPVASLLMQRSFYAAEAFQLFALKEYEAAIDRLTQAAIADISLRDAYEWPTMEVHRIHMVENATRVEIAAGNLARALDLSKEMLLYLSGYPTELDSFTLTCPPTIKSEDELLLTSKAVSFCSLTSEIFLKDAQAVARSADLLDALIEANDPYSGIRRFCGNWAQMIRAIQLREREAIIASFDRWCKEAVIGTPKLLIEMLLLLVTGGLVQSDARLAMLEITTTLWPAMPKKLKCQVDHLSLCS